jgi:glycosyltransferase involved in cell wall biosynthesis
MVAPGDSIALAEAVEGLASDPGERLRMGLRGREFVSEHYDRTILAQRYLELLREVGGPRQPGATSAGEVDAGTGSLAGAERRPR